MSTPTQQDVVATLEQLVRIPSVNPMGQDASGPPYYEQQLTDYLQQFFQQLGVAWQRQRVAPHRDNIVARLDGTGHGILVWEVHQDTVPVDGMTIDPFAPVVRDGRLYGRGACDDKGPMASMLTAFARLAASPPAQLPTIVMACTVNEESGFTGAAALAEVWANGTDSFLSRLPDAVVVAEPTSLDIVVTHKGVVRWSCETWGRAAHSSYPERGANAIYAMGPVITACAEYAQSLRSQPPHTLLGTPTISLGTIRGGVSVNTVPDRCRVEFDRRLLPEEDPELARQAAIDRLAQQLPQSCLRKFGTCADAQLSRTAGPIGQCVGPADPGGAARHGPDGAADRRTVCHRCPILRCLGDSHGCLWPRLDRTSAHGRRMDLARNVAARRGSFPSAGHELAGREQAIRQQKKAHRRLS